MKQHLHVNLLYRLPGNERYYHIFPAGDAKQDNSLKFPTKFFLGKKETRLFKLKSIPQKDGSRFRVIRPDVNANANTIKSKIEYFAPSMLPIIFESTDNSWQTAPKNECKLLFYWTHTFLNGYRGFLFLVREKAYCFWDIGKLLEDLIPEDNWGILVQNLDTINNHEAIQPYGLPEVDVIEYLTAVRLCHCCGVVNNMSLPRVRPWLTYKNRIRYEEHEQLHQYNHDRQSSHLGRSQKSSKK